MDQHSAACDCCDVMSQHNRGLSPEQISARWADHTLQQLNIAWDETERVNSTPTPTVIWSGSPIDFYNHIVRESQRDAELPDQDSNLD